jgi:phosphoribosylaminoimidazole (AIR) synthetase
MQLLAALGGLEAAEVRATFNGGIGMVLVVPPAARTAVAAALPDAVLVGEVAPVAVLGARYVEAPLLA